MEQSKFNQLMEHTKAFTDVNPHFITSLTCDQAIQYESRVISLMDWDGVQKEKDKLVRLVEHLKEYPSDFPFGDALLIYRMGGGDA